MKDLLSILLIFALCFGIGFVPNLNLHSKAKPTSGTYGDYEYRQMEYRNDWDREKRIEITKYNGNDSIVTIPDEIEGITVRSIGKEAFKGNGFVSEVVFPDKLQEIQGKAFSDCSNLSIINFNNNLCILGERAFANCLKIKKISLPKTETRYDGEVIRQINYVDDGEDSDRLSPFEGCVNLETVIIEEGTQCIPVSFCHNNTALKTITIPDSVKKIELYAFEGCTNLETVNISDNSKLEILSMECFKNCISIKEFYLPESLTYLAAFYGCSSLQHIEIPDSVTTVAGFTGCSSLKELVLPKNLKSLGRAFIQGTGITSITLPKSLEEGIYAFENTDVDVKFEKGFETLPRLLFANSAFESIDLPDTLKRIEESVFWGSKIRWIVIPKGVEYISQNGNPGALGPVKTIYGYTGTTAEDYASKFNVEFIPIGDFKKIGFKYLSTYKDKEKNEIEGATYCYYSDDYFSDNPFEDKYNASLATMSMALAWSTFNSPDGGKTDYSNKFKNAKQLMDNIGMKDIETNSFYSEKPYMESIGVICGNKSISVNGNNYTLIACAIRGGGYESEWSSNFTIGTSGEHEGFADAKKKVLVFLKGYIDKNEIKGNVKFWITGYSRAAAAANLTAAAIDDRSANLGNAISYSPKDVYAYTFETPAGAIDNVKYSKIYENIFNIINPSDPVPYVAPSRIGFGRYGIDYYYPTIGVNRKYGDSKRNMKAIFDSLPYSDLLVSDSNKRVYDRVDSFKMKKINYEAVKAIQLNASEALSPNDANIVIDDTNNIMVQSCFLNEFFDTISDDVMIDRNNFVKQYQEVLRDFFRITNGNSEIYKQFFKELKESNIIRKVLTAVNPNPLIDVLLDCLFACFAVSASDQVPNKTELLDIVIKGAPLIYRIVQANPDYFATLLSNADGIGCGHYPELCFSWVASMDKNYNPNAKVTFTPFAYRKVRINCDVNVSVYDSNNTLVAQINNEKATDLNNDYMYGIDNDGQKFVILPIDEDYTIEIQAYNDTVVNYGVSEYSADAGTYTRNVNFFDIKLDKDEKITGDVSSYLPEEIETDTMQASHATYTIKDTNDVVIKASSDLKDEESVNATYYVDASSSNDEHGLVYGAGSHQFGHYAQLEAAAREGYKFIGWFIDNDLVSAESSYRFRVDSDIKVIGKFDKLTDDSESQNVDTKLNGIVQGPDGKWAMYKEGIVDTSATGVFQNKLGWWRVEKGYVNFDAQGIYQNQYGWWKTTNGKVTFKENGVFQNENGWWRVKDSKVNFYAQGIYQNKNGWWKTTNGRVTFKENGVFQNENGWWKVKDSKVDFNFTGIASNKYGSWYVKTGKVDFNKNGKVKYNNKTYIIKNGKVV